MPVAYIDREYVRLFAVCAIRADSFVRWRNLLKNRGHEFLSILRNVGVLALRNFMPVPLPNQQAWAFPSILAFFSLQCLCFIARFPF